jgi:hypothetical protein
MVFAQAGREKALTLVAGHIRDQNILAVPELFFYEVSNILTLKLGFLQRRFSRP